MAEVFGVVVSALTVAEMAGKFGSSILKLKKLWDEVQDVPNEISQLVRQLELLRPVLAEMESGFTQQTHKVYQNSAANLSMEYCQQAVAELDALAEDLRSRVDAAKRSRRNITKLKVTFKKDQIRGYQDKIQFALQLLSLSQQTYTISMVKSRFLTFSDPGPQAGSTQTTTSQQSFQPESAVENTQVRRKVSSRTHQELTAPAMPCRKASFFGGFIYHTVSDPNHPDIEVYQARVQLPWWISETFWDFQAYRAYTGWKVSLKPWTMRPDDDPIFEYVREGLMDDVLKALKSNEASLHDIETNGWTLLHFAVSHGHSNLTKRLIEMGLDLDIVNGWNGTPLRYMGFTPPGLRLSFFQLLLDTGELDDDIERCFMSQDVGGISSNLPEIIWTAAGALDMMIKRSIGLDSYYRLPVYTRFRCLDWAWIDAKILLDDIHKGGNLQPRDFRPVLDFSDDSSLDTFTWEYFDHLGSSDIYYDYPNRMSEIAYQRFHPWRNLARWVFGGLSVKDLSQMKNNERWHPLSKQILGGLVEWQYCLFWISTRFTQPRFAQKAFLIWLEDVQASGIDLVEYGRQELEIYLTLGSLQGRRWFYRRLPRYPVRRDFSATSGWKLASFTYGPEPRDWKFTWDLDAWEYAGDFWELIDNPPLHVPGAWVDDESW